ILGILDADDVPPDLPFDRRRDLLFKVIPLKPELRLIILRASSLIDAHEVELPCAAAIESGLDGNAVANLPTKALSRLGPGNGSLAVCEEVRPLIVGND